MNKIVIFGTGIGSKRVKDILIEGKSDIIGYLDNRKDKWNGDNDGIKIFPPVEIISIRYDYVIISTVYYEIIKKQLLNYGVPENKIVSYYFDFYYGEKYKSFINVHKWYKNALPYYIESKIELLKKEYNLLINNLPYEIADKYRKKVIKLPNFASNKECINKIIFEKCSLCRFGDGEFEIIRNKDRAKFQATNLELSKRLREILKCNKKNILIAIANNYGALDDKYISSFAMGIREYMTEDTRRFHESILDFNRTYYDAYISRPYMMWIDKTKAKERFDMLKMIWNKRNVVIIEGKYTRMGVGNDLLNNANYVKRIIAPEVDAWDRYSDILKAARRFDKNTLFLIALGPAATVLAYDLAEHGFQAVDIGHLDIEYEWYLKGVCEKVDISYKYVNEVAGGELVKDIFDEEYERQIYQYIDTRCK